MPYFIMLTRLSSESVRSPEALEKLEGRVMEQIRKECKAVEWVHNYTVLGPYDYVDIFRAPDMDEAFKVSTIIRTFGHAHTEVWGAIEWKHYKDMVRHLPAGACD